MLRLIRHVAIVVFIVTLFVGTARPTGADVLTQGGTLSLGQSLDSTCCSLTLQYVGPWWFGVESYFLMWDVGGLSWASIIDSHAKGWHQGIGYHTHQWGPVDEDGFLTVQGDGNVVLYDSSLTPGWSTNTGNNSGAYLNAQDDGNLVVYTASDVPLWSVY